MPVRVALGHIDEYDDSIGVFAQQLGLTSVHLNCPTNLPGLDGYWSIAELEELKRSCAQRGLVVEAIENVPAANFWKIQRGVAGRDAQIEGYLKTIRNLAAVDIRVLGYNFMPSFVWRTDMSVPGRGGVTTTAFDLEKVHFGNAAAGYANPSSALGVEEEQRQVAAISAEETWENYQYFLDAVLPTAEDAGVRLALHPDDPPVEDPGSGLTQIMTTPDALLEAYRRSGESSAWALTLCLGTVSEMGGEDAINKLVDYFGPMGRICYVHFRDVQGVVPKFQECFLGEGNYRPARVLRRLERSGFDGFLIDDHVPAMIGDVDSWIDSSPAAFCSRGRAYMIGYIQGLCEALDGADACS